MQAKDQQFTASIADASGKVFRSYTPVGPDPHDPLPPKVANPKEPKEYTSAELAYEVGLRLDQFQNGILDPVPYYKRALEIDPDYSRANVAMGVRLAKNGCYAEAKPYLEKAVARAKRDNKDEPKFDDASNYPAVVVISSDGTRLLFRMPSYDKEGGFGVWLTTVVDMLRTAQVEPEVSKAIEKILENPTEPKKWK